MRLVRPVEVDSSVLISTNAVDESSWSSGTTYGQFDVVRGPAPYDKLAYESVQAGNLNHPVTDQAWWLAFGSSNKWRMFDQSPQSQTTRADNIDVTLTPGARIDTLALQNVSAASVQVTMTDLVEGVVYDETFAMISDSGITDWWAYFFEPIVRVTELQVEDLPPYATATLDVTLTATGETVACGLCVIGLSRDIGKTQWGAGVGIQDYSVKQVDDFGNATVVQRAYSKRANFSMLVPWGQVDQLQVLLASYRATPTLYIGDPDYTSTAVYGYFRDFNMEIAYPDVSLCTLEIEGLA
jgi:hypothetical protein